MLGGASGVGQSSSIMEGAAEARLHKIKSKMDATSGAAAETAAPLSPGRRVVRLLADAIALATVGSGLASLYYYLRYDVKELQTIVEETKVGTCSISDHT